MLDFFIGSLPTILVGAAVLSILLAIAVKMYRDKKKGKSSCGCSCANCPCAGSCHTK